MVREISMDQSPSLLQGDAVIARARLEAVSGYLKTSKVKCVLDIGCGYSPRAAYCIKEGIDYIGTDNPSVIEDLRSIALSSETVKGHPVFIGVNAADDDSVQAAADYLDGEITVLYEGSSVNLSVDQLQKNLECIRAILKKHGGSWIATDLGVDHEALLASEMRGNDLLRIFRNPRARVADASSVSYNKIFGWDEDRIMDFIENSGFIVETMPFYHGDEEHVIFNGVPEKRAKKYRDILNRATLWRMTVDPGFDLKPRIEGVKLKDEMEMRYTVDKGLLSCSVKGRLDILSGPAFLEIIEKNVEKISRIEIDAKELEYISSAGLRILVIAVKKNGPGSLIIKNASDPVRQLFEMTGFDSMINVE